MPPDPPSRVTPSASKTTAMPWGGGGGEDSIYKKGSMLLRPLGGTFLLKCNYDVKSLKVNIPIPFYNEALHAWQIINSSAPHSKEEILIEIIWNNRFIKINGYSVYYKTWHKAGVEKLKHIICGNEFLSYEAFCGKFKLNVNFLLYFGLCHAISADWVKIIKDTQQAEYLKELCHGLCILKNLA